MSRPSGFGTIIEIGNVLVSEDVVCEFFSCDYAKCKGICCKEGDSGAPLLESEPELLERDYPVYSSLMGPEGLSAVRQKGFFEIDREGDMVTPVVEGSGECAYVTLGADGGYLCSVERCFFSGKCSFRKPVSCRLYPIRVTNLTGGGKALNLHRWRICEDAYRKGREEGIRVYQFLREPLTEVFGADFYDALDAAARHILSI